jgi:zinc protease
MSNLTRRATLQVAAAAVASGAVSPQQAEAQGTGSGATAPPAVAAERPLFGAEVFVLPNGLRVAFVESRRAPVIAQYLFYGAGAGEDPAGRSGTAHFLEHMMFKGSPRVASGEFSRRVAREGGNDNAFTSRDVTAYYQHVEASRLPLVAMMEADRLAAALIPADEVESERQVVLEERRQRTDTNPRALFGEAFDAALWGPQHWRGRPIIGWPDEIRAITRQDLLDFHARWYAPANAVLAVSGAVGIEEMKRVAAEEYGAVPARAATPARNRPGAPETIPVQERITRNDPRVPQPSFARAMVAPTLSFGDRRHAYPLEVLAHLLGSGPGSRLHRALVEAGLAVSAGAGYDSESLGIGEFNLFAAPRPGTTPERVEAVLVGEVKRLLDDGVQEEEVRRSIRQMTAGALLSLDSFGAAPRMIGSALAIGLPLEAVEYWPARIRGVTAAQVIEAARAVLGGGTPSASGWLLPEGVTAPPEQRA